MSLSRPVSRDSMAVSAALAPHAVERLMRLKSDLSLGLPVVLTDGSRAALIGWAETLTDERMAALSALGEPELAVTRRRADALGLEFGPDAGDVLRVSAAGTLCSDVVQAIAGDRADEPGACAPIAEPASAIHVAAVRLAKAAQVLPAAVVVPVDPAQAEALRADLSTMRARDVTEALDEERRQLPVSAARLPMDVAQAGRVHVFRAEDGAAEHYAIKIGAPDLTWPVTVRLHSACFTGDVLGSRKCDCGAQLRAAMSAMAENGGGLLLYLNQEGRGIGLANKMRAYALQDAGLDTVEANHWLGFEDDERDFRIGANLLHRLGVARVRLMTNNPAKIANLAAQGIEILERVPLDVGRNACNAAYLDVKATKSGHLLT